MNCPRCRTSLPEQAKFCPQCGHDLSDALKSGNGQKSEKQKASFSEPVKSYGLILLAVLIASLIVFLILDSNVQQHQNNAEISSAPIEISDEIKALIEKLKQDPLSLDLNIKTGNLLFDAGNFTEAIGYYQQALQIDSLNVPVRIDLAVCFFNLQKNQQAISGMLKALQIDPDHEKGLFNIGIMYMTIGKADSTRFYWKRLISGSPESDEARRASGNAPENVIHPSKFSVIIVKQLKDVSKKTELEFKKVTLTDKNLYETLVSKV